MAALDAVASEIKLVVLDVDGVMTTGTVTYTSDGQELKSFNIKDGLGIKLLQRGGLQVAIVTGRISAMVERRAAELGIKELVQGRDDKLAAVSELASRLGLGLHEIAYMGDDLPDLPAIQACGLGACPADATALVLARADWVAAHAGGQGAIREWAEELLKTRGCWSELLSTFEL